MMDMAFLHASPFYELSALLLCAIIIGFLSLLLRQPMIYFARPQSAVFDWLFFPQFVVFILTIGLLLRCDKNDKLEQK